MKKYNVNATELHSIIANFELSASKISKKQRSIRRKYLIMLLKAIDQEQQKLIGSNPLVAINIKQNKGNYDALIILIKRIIKLMINEIDVIDKKDNSMSYILIALLVIIFILLIKKN